MTKIDKLLAFAKAHVDECIDVYGEPAGWYQMHASLAQGAATTALAYAVASLAETAKADTPAETSALIIKLSVDLGTALRERDDAVARADRAIAEGRKQAEELSTVAIDAAFWKAETQAITAAYTELREAAEAAYTRLIDPYLGEDNGERQQPEIDMLEAVLAKNLGDAS